MKLKDVELTMVAILGFIALAAVTPLWPYSRDWSLIPFAIGSALLVILAIVIMRSRD